MVPSNYEPVPTINPMVDFGDREVMSNESNHRFINNSFTLLDQLDELKILIKDN